MIGLDTNVLVRFLVRDDEEQFEQARKPIRREAQPCSVTLLRTLTAFLMETPLSSSAHPHNGRRPRR
jgi:predicted nucleic acid-binding protein